MTMIRVGLVALGCFRQCGHRFAVTGTSIEHFRHVLVAVIAPECTRGAQVARDRELKVNILGDASSAKKAFKDVDDAADKSQSRLQRTGSAIGGFMGAIVSGGLAAA